MWYYRDWLSEVNSLFYVEIIIILVASVATAVWRERLWRIHPLLPTILSGLGFAAAFSLIPFSLSENPSPSAAQIASLVAAWLFVTATWHLRLSKAKGE